MSRHPVPLSLETMAGRPARIKTAAVEASVTPIQGVPAEPSARIKNNKVAAATYRRLLRVYSTTAVPLITALDIDQLEDYCVTVAELADIRKLVADTKERYNETMILVKEFINNHDFDRAALFEGTAIDYEKVIVRLDGQVDRKVTLLNHIRQTLYLTPRTRAGAVPQARSDEPADDFQALLDEVEVYVNREK